jgi:hypothetical protein
VEHPPAREVLEAVPEPVAVARDPQRLYLGAIGGSMASSTGTGSKRKKCVFATLIPRSLRVKTTPVESFTFSTTAKRAPGFSGPKKSRFAAADIGRQDEMLDLLFWLEGEGFPGHATLPTIARFLTWSEGDAERILRRLVARGDVVGGPAGDYRLTQRATTPIASAARKVPPSATAGRNASPRARFRA